MIKRLIELDSLELLEEDVIKTLGQEAWEICDLLMHQYGTRQIAKIMGVSSPHVKLTISNLRQLLYDHHYIQELDSEEGGQTDG